MMMVMLLMAGSESIVWEDNGARCWRETSAANGSRRRRTRDWKRLQQVWLMSDRYVMSCVVYNRLMLT